MNGVSLVFFIFEWSLFWVFLVFEERKRRIWILFLVLSEYRLRLWLFVVKTNHKPAFVSCLPARFDSRLEHAWLILTQLDSFSHRSRIRRENRIIWEISDKAGGYLTVVQMYENIQKSLICIILKVTYID